MTAERRMVQRSPDEEAMLDDLQRKSFRYFERHVNPENGLVLDSTRPGQPFSIAAVGFALASYPVGVERGFMRRTTALKHTLAALKFFDEADQSGDKAGVGQNGFFYHFLEADSATRAWNCEISTIDTSLLLAGVIQAAAYFDRDTAREREVRERALSIYARADWRWALNGKDTLALGWKPETGFLVNSWLGYDESLIMQVLALAAPRFALKPSNYDAWTASFNWRHLYGEDVLYAGPLFIHQFSHIWLDLRGIRDKFMTTKKTDYFENSRVATQIQRQYAIRNPRKYLGYGKNCWGFSAGDGPGNATATYRGRKHKFYDYIARGAPFGPDDGTISPWAAIASLPFAPGIVLEEIHHLEELIGHGPEGYGFHASFNRSWPDAHTKGAHRYTLKSGTEVAWVSPRHFALHQGPIILMIENYRSEMIWNLMRRCAPIRLGLQRAGFQGGWLSGPTDAKQ